MKITVENKEIINSGEIRVHDGEMGVISYNYEDKSCTFEVLNLDWKNDKLFISKAFYIWRYNRVSLQVLVRTFYVGIMIKNLLEQKNYTREK